jgi:hypothetical protein
MTTIGSKKKAHWSIAASTYVLIIFMFGMIGLLVTVLIQDILDYPMIFERDWGFVLFGAFLLMADSILAFQSELTDGGNSLSLIADLESLFAGAVGNERQLQRPDPAFALGLTALGLFSVAPGVALKIYFGGLALLAASMLWVLRLAAKKTAGLK